jgi:hypothetical protein
MRRLEDAGRNAIEAFSEGDEQKMLLMGLKRYAQNRTLQLQGGQKAYCCPVN